MPSSVETIAYHQEKWETVIPMWKSLYSFEEEMIKEPMLLHS